MPDEPVGHDRLEFHCNRGPGSAMRTTTSALVLSDGLMARILTGVTVSIAHLATPSRITCEIEGHKQQMRERRVLAAESAPL
jgi:hypothetical protein